MDWLRHYFRSLRQNRSKPTAGKKTLQCATVNKGRQAERIFY